jgi:glycosyltransferase involved in cell wall biosynthesis
MPKVILISQLPLPFSDIASWTTMYNYYLQKGNHEFDFIICPQPKGELIDGVEYSLVKNSTFLTKLKSKINQHYRWNSYFKALDKIIKPNEKYVIQIIDNSGFVVPLNAHIGSKYKRENFYIQYYYHGFYPLFTNPSERTFFSGINEMIFLTKLSYKLFLDYYIDFICKASVLKNAIDSKQFFKLDNSTREKQKQLMGFKSKIIFIWCSQDRPKKGLDFILQVWKKIYEKYGSEVELLIVGANRESEYLGVNFIGRVPNDELAKYYQISDFYLFPTFWKEGFGIVLSEALKCGCYCIASNQGGVPEVLQFGKIGRIVENPNFIKEWVLAIEEGIEIYRQNDYNNPYSTFIGDDLYDIDNWCNEMNSIIQESKYNLIN